MAARQPDALFLNCQHIGSLVLVRLSAVLTHSPM
jgi:hypothetical protein